MKGTRHIMHARVSGCSEETVNQSINQSINHVYWTECR